MKRFIHIPKNGGMSLRHGLKGKIKTTSKNDVPPDYAKEFLATMKKHNEHAGFEHARWRDLNDKAKRDRCFAIVRNPWARVVSRYTFMMTAFENGTIQKRGQKQYKKWSFEEFLEQRHQDAEIPYFWHRAIRGWYTQKSYVVDDKQVLQCDILRLDSDEVQRYFQLKEPLRKRNVSKTRTKDYKEYYTDKTIQIVADWYQEDIEFFGFDFDSVATKNTIYNL